MLLALVLGAAAGWLLHPWHDVPWLGALFRNAVKPVGQIFLGLLFLSVVPLVFSALVLGVWELGRGRGLGRVASRTLLWTVLASGVSVLIGVGVVEVLQPGRGMPLDAGTIAAHRATVQAVQQQAQKAGGFGDAVAALLPRNPVEAAAGALRGEMLPFMVFALLFGLAMVLSRPKDAPSRVIEGLEEVFGASMTIVGLAMKLAPLGVFAIVFGTLFEHGAGVLRALGWYVLAVVGGLALQTFAVYPLLLKVGAGRSPLAFFRGIREVAVQAFSTASSNATLPTSLQAAERQLGITPRVARFVLTVGATGNQNGTALFEGVTVLFLAQVYGVELDLAAQVRVVLLSMVAGIGAAGVPGSSLPMIALLLHDIGVPPEGLGLILGADRFLDMCRTTVNVTGDLVIATLVDEPELGQEPAVAQAE